MDRHKHTLENTQGSGQYGPLINVRDPLAPIIYTTTESEVSQHSHNCYKNETTVIGLHATPNQNQPVITSQADGSTPGHPELPCALLTATSQMKANCETSSEGKSCHTLDSHILQPLSNLPPSPTSGARVSRACHIWPMPISNLETEVMSSTEISDISYANLQWRDRSLTDLDSDLSPEAFARDIDETFQCQPSSMNLILPSTDVDVLAIAANFRLHESSFFGVPGPRSELAGSLAPRHLAVINPITDFYSVFPPELSPLATSRQGADQLRSGSSLVTTYAQGTSTRTAATQIDYYRSPLTVSSTWTSMGLREDRLMAAGSEVPMIFVSTAEERSSLGPSTGAQVGTSTDTTSQARTRHRPQRSQSCTVIPHQRSQKANERSPLTGQHISLHNSLDVLDEISEMIRQPLARRCSVHSSPPETFGKPTPDSTMPFSQTRHRTPSGAQVGTDVLQEICRMLHPPTL
ncbi:hypothetical protein AcW1_009189 [Taiwanofungus camphoratus]|nr:hypothetical protein AcW1_009189 [Antrodia cinnamomea]